MFTERNEMLAQQLKHSKLNVDSVKQELNEYKDKATRILQVSQTGKSYGYDIWGSVCVNHMGKLDVCE